MKNRILVAAIMLIFACPVFGQVSYPTNDPNLNPIPLGYLGWDDNTNTNLDINQNNTLRQRFTSVNWAGLNGLSANNASRIHLGLNGNFQNPFSMIHMGTNLNANLQRPWMNVGMTMGATADILHLGLIQRPVPGGPAAQVDAVIAWGCNDDDFSPFAGPDNFRFLFMTPTTLGGDGAEQQGRETMRITPMGNVGIGDFSHMPNGLNEQPTQRLDVDGQVRVRDVPGDPAQVLITGRQASAVGDYILRHLAFPDDETVFLNGEGDWTSLTADDCRWQDVNSITIPGELDMFTGLDPEEDCYRGKVGIGLNQIRSKLGVESILERDQVLIGTLSRSTGVGGDMNQSLVGVYGLADANGNPSSSLINAGVLGEGYDSRYTIGVRGIGHAHPGGATTGSAFGIMGQASGAMNYNAAVYGEVTAPGDYSGYFVGGLFTTTGTPVIISDESVKNSVESFEGASEILNQLQPRTYYYQSPGNRDIAFQENLQYGFIAQEVQEILPDIVKSVTVPEKMDSTGVIEGSSVELLGVQYESLIPILVAGYQEQQNTIENLEQIVSDQNEALSQVMDQLQALQQQVNDCCQTDGALPKSFGIGNDDSEDGSVFGKNELHQNTPNPFRSQTTISYSLETGGKVLLNVYDKAGKILSTLEESEQPAGTYRYEWDASGLPAGLYHYALYVDGELLVKKAIKLAD